MLRLAHGKRALLTVLACLSFACSRSPQTAEVTIRLEEPTASLASATILVDYSQAAASPLTRGGDPACTSIAPNVTAEFGDDRQGHLTITADAAGGFSPPIDLAVCRMVPETTSATASAIAARLRISVLNATDTAGVALDDRQLASARSAARRLAAATAEGGGSGDSGGTTGGAGRTGSAAGGGSASAGERAAAGGQAAADGATGDSAVTSPGTRTGGMGTSPEVGRRLIPPDRTAAARSPGSPSPGAPGADGGDSGGADDGGDPALGKADANEDSDTDRSATAYLLTIGVTTQGKLGALQFNLQHHGASGGFAGAGASARCTNTGAAASAMATFNDVGNGVLRAGFIDLNGFDTPGAVATCTFKSRDAVTASDFSVEVVDATTPDLEPQNVSVAVMDLRAQ